MYRGCPWVQMDYIHRSWRITTSSESEAGEYPERSALETQFVTVVQGVLNYIPAKNPKRLAHGCPDLRESRDHVLVRWVRVA